MEQMTAGMMSYFLSISKLQASTSAVPVGALSVLSPVRSAILGERGRLRFGARRRAPAVLSQVHLSRVDDWKRRDDVVKKPRGGCDTSSTHPDTSNPPPKATLAFQNLAKKG